MKLLALTLLLATLSGCTKYNHDQPDTPANKQGFAHRFGKEPGPDVKGIYFYADELGADCKYQLRFECSPKTLDSLVQSLSLTNTTKVEGHLPGIDFPWWNGKSIDALPLHWRANEKKDYYWFLWYDALKSEGFFLEYSL
jgi:hypothetical protein